MLALPAFNYVSLIMMFSLLFLNHLAWSCCCQFNGFPSSLFQCLSLSLSLPSPPFTSVFQALTSSLKLMMSLPAFHNVAFIMSLALALLLLNHLAWWRCFQFTGFLSTLFYCLTLSLSLSLSPSLSLYPSLSLSLSPSLSSFPPLPSLPCFRHL